MIESNEPPSVIDIVATGNGPDNRLAVLEIAGNGTFVGMLEALDASGTVIPSVSFEIVDANGAVVPPALTPFRINGSQIVVDIDGANDLLSYNVDASLTVNVRAVLGDGSYQEPVPISVWFNSGCDSAGNYFRVSLDITDQYDWAETVYIYAGGPDGPLIDVQQLNDDGSSQRTLYGAPDFLVQTITTDPLGRETDRWTVYDDTHADRTLRDPGQMESSYETYTQYFERIGGTWQIYDEYGVRDGGDAGWRTRNDLRDAQDWQQIYEEFAINGPVLTRTRETVLYDDGHIVTTLF